MRRNTKTEFLSLRISGKLKSELKEHVKTVNSEMTEYVLDAIIDRMENEKKLFDTVRNVTTC